nr:MAG: hypothetical protein [Bacteriophage sp.]
MKVIYNKIIPLKGYKCINLFGVLFVRKGCTMRESDYNHEAIHTKQMKELLYVPFYILYLLEWFYRLTQKGNAYRNISLRRKPIITRTIWIILIKENIFLGLNTFEFYIYE